jgi:hypothetical protein
MTRELLCAAASECCISAFERQLRGRDPSENDTHRYAGITVVWVVITEAGRRALPDKRSVR